MKIPQTTRKVVKRGFVGDEILPSYMGIIMNHYQHLQRGAKWFLRMSLHHPLGFNWHPFEGAGRRILINQFADAFPKAFNPRWFVGPSWIESFENWLFRIYFGDDTAQLCGDYPIIEQNPVLTCFNQVSKIGK